MIRWTRAGAVAEATTVQIRINRAFVGRIGAGAPEPSRDLSGEEVLSNVAHFTTGRAGPRTQPCTGLVLSGGGLLRRGDLPQVIEGARGLGIKRVVLHGGEEEIEGLARLAAADELVVSALSVEAVVGLQAIPLQKARLSVVLPMRKGVVDRLEALFEQLQGGPIDRVVLTWPFGGEAPPPADQVVQALQEAAGPLEALPMPWGVKNLPRCQLGSWELEARRIWRSGNRWYVDADHQGAEALLFFPDVLRFHKADSCRYCKWDRDCDGVFERWHREGLTKPLQPI
jgi:hypothetical protein